MCETGEKRIGLFRSHFQGLLSFALSELDRSIRDASKIQCEICSGVEPRVYQGLAEPLINVHLPIVANVHEQLQALFAAPTIFLRKARSVSRGAR